MWLALCLAGMSIRTECLGITSLIRAIGLKDRAIASKQTANSIKKLSIFMSISYCAYQINSA
jgi:hypothetical protein